MPMNEKFCIRSGTVITDTESRIIDVYCEDGIIRTIGENLSVPQDTLEIDARGKIVLPGGVDAHVHLDLPMFDTVSSDDHYTGMKAAAFGGTTTVIDFVPHDDIDFEKNIDRWHAKADPKAAVDFGFHMNVTRFSARILEQIKRLPHCGITSLKVFTAYNHRLRLEDEKIKQVLAKAGEEGILTMLHAEEGDEIERLTAEAIVSGHKDPIWHARTRPAAGAESSASRIFTFAHDADALLYLVHMNTAGEAQLLEKSRRLGWKVMGETCPQYLFFTEKDLEREDAAKWICSPPLRSERDQNRLWEGLQKEEIQVISTDHCPFFFKGDHAIQYEGEPIRIPGKELGRDDFTKIPNGLPGVGDRLPILWTKAVNTAMISAQKFVALTSTNPAKIFGMYPKKGAIQPGSDADLVIWDSKKIVKYGVKIAKHRTDYNLYEGWRLKGFPEKVFLRGNLIVDGDKWYGRSGMGKYITRASTIMI